MLGCKEERNMVLKVPPPDPPPPHNITHPPSLCVCMHVLPSLSFSLSISAFLSLSPPLSRPSFHSTSVCVCVCVSPSLSVSLSISLSPFLFLSPLSLFFLFILLLLCSGLTYMSIPQARAPSHSHNSSLPHECSVAAVTLLSSIGILMLFSH